MSQLSLEFGSVGGNGGRPQRLSLRRLVNADIRTENAVHQNRSKLEPVCSTSQHISYPLYLGRLGDNSTTVKTIGELTVGPQGQCVLKEDETQRGWYTPTGPGFSGNISCHILPFNYDSERQPFVDQVKFNGGAPININPNWDINNVILTKNHILHIKPTQKELDILDLKTEKKESIQLNGLPDKSYVQWANVGRDLTKLIIVDHSDNYNEGDSRHKLITIKDGDKTTIAPLYTNASHEVSTGSNQGFVMVYKDETTKKLMLRLIDNSDTEVELPDQLKSKFIGSKFDVAITATGEILLKALSDIKYMEFSIAKETVKESSPLTMAAFNQKSITLDTKNGYDHIENLDEKHTLIHSRYSENQILLIKKNDDGRLEKMNFNLPQFDGLGGWFSGSINGKMITIDVEVYTQTNTQYLSILYDLNQGNYPVATMTTPENTQQSSTPAQPSSTNTPQEITTTQNSGTTSISFSPSAGASTTVIVPTPAPATTTANGVPTSTSTLTTTNKNGETTVTTTTNIGAVSTTFHHDGSTTTTTPNGEFSTPAPTPNEGATVEHTTSGDVIITTNEGTTTIAPTGIISSTSKPINDGDEPVTSVLKTSSLTNIPHQTNATVVNVINALNLTISPLLNITKSNHNGIDQTPINDLSKTTSSTPINVQNVTIPINPTDEPSSNDAEHNYSINLIVVGGVIIGAFMVCTILGVCIKRAIDKSRIAPRDIEMPEIGSERPTSNQYSTRIGKGLSIVFSQRNDDAGDNSQRSFQKLLWKLWKLWKPNNKEVEEVVVAT